MSPTPTPPTTTTTTTRCPIRGVGGGPPYGQRITRTRAASAPRATLPPPAGNHPHLPTANPLLMAPPARPGVVHGRRSAPPRSPETSLSEGSGEAVGKLGAGVLAHAPQDSFSVPIARRPVRPPCPAERPPARSPTRSPATAAHGRRTAPAARRNGSICTSLTRRAHGPRDRSHASPVACCIAETLSPALNGSPGAARPSRAPLR